MECSVLSAWRVWLVIGLSRPVNLTLWRTTWEERVSMRDELDQISLWELSWLFYLTWDNLPTVGCTIPKAWGPGLTGCRGELEAICPLWGLPFPKLQVLGWLAVKESWRLAWAALWYFSRPSKSESLRAAPGKMGGFHLCDWLQWSFSWVTGEPSVCLLAFILWVWDNVEELADSY